MPGKEVIGVFADFRREGKTLKKYQISRLKKSL